MSLLFLGAASFSLQGLCSPADRLLRKRSVG